MSMVRVDELAQEYSMSPEELFSQLKAMGFDVVNITSSVDRHLVDMVSDVLTGKPREDRTKTSKRRIVSVRKGETTTEVEVRLEETPPEPLEETAGESPGEVGPEAAAQPVGEIIPPPEEEGTAEESGAPEVVGADGQGEEAAPEEIPPASAAAPSSEEAVRPREKKRIPVTTLEIEKDLSSQGSEIPTVKVIRQAAEVQAPPEKVEVKEEKKEAEIKPPKKMVEEESEKPKKGPGKKGRKASRKVILEEVEEIESVEEDLGDKEEAPSLKVVEIKYPAAPKPAHRKESPRKRGKKSRKREREEAPVSEGVKQAPKIIRIVPGLTVSDLASLTGTKASEIIKVLFQLGVMATINQTLDPETAGLVASELGFEVEVKTQSLDDLLKEEAEDSSKMVPRSPVVTVMGHVDHGKTSLLDAVRETDVVSGEAGGITQHIGAHLVHHKKGDLVFLDTPGHEAFTAMRSRGAQVTDIVVLVVAADDGVKPQTVEAINHAKAAGVPIVVAINKIDKPDSDPERVIRELSDHGVLSEEWGGESLFAKVSAKKRIGMDELLDLILLQAEMLELKADPNRNARGTVIESKLDRGRGAVATVLVQKGTLRAGDLMVAGAVMGRVRALVDDRGKKMDEAGPSIPVEVLGLGGVPAAGEKFVVFTDELKAKKLAQMRETALQAEKTGRKKVTLEDFFKQVQEGQVKDLDVVLKADVQGSCEAIRDAMMQQSTDLVRVRVIHEGTGGINEGDVMLAAASDAIIIGFNVRPDNKALEMIRREQVDVRYYNVIYEVVKDIRDALRGLLAPVFHEEVLGRAEIRQTFTLPKAGTIAGCYVVNGLMRRNAKVRVLRNGVVIHDGKIDSLKRFKEDAREVASGYECGIGVEGFNDLKEGDVLENYEMIAQEAEL
ncbi:MAG: translation initiation factor IF-2 [Proteobacteria bacterium]|nr:translation initiation factor IF-2 [Pseudomonadota bacterium]